MTGGGGGGWISCMSLQHSAGGSTESDLVSGGPGLEAAEGSGIRLL